MIDVQSVSMVNAKEAYKVHKSKFSVVFFNQSAKIFVRRKFFHACGVTANQCCNKLKNHEKVLDV